MISKIFYWLTAGMSETAAAAVAAALIALCGVAVSALVSMVVSRRAGYVTAVTIERARWINSLRENIAAYSGQVQALVHKIECESVNVEHDGYLRQRAERAPLINEIGRLQSLIRLQLNPKADIDPNIILLLKKIRDLSEAGTTAPLSDAEELLIAHSQWLLKDEWETVKAEARQSIIPFLKRWNKHSRQRLYKEFCEGAGCIKSVFPDPNADILDF